MYSTGCLSEQGGSGYKGGSGAKCKNIQNKKGKWEK